MDVNEMATIPGILGSSTYNHCVSTVRKLAKNLNQRAGGSPSQVSEDGP